MSQPETEPARSRSVASSDPLTLLAFGGVVLLGGMNGIAAKQLLRELDPFWVGVLRFAVAGAIMTVIVLASRRSLPRGRSLLGALAYGALGFAITFAFFFAGLRDTPVSTAAIFLALTPLLTLGLAIIHRQEPFRVQGLLGSLLALGGVALIFADQLTAAVPLGSLVLLALGALSLAETGIVVKMIPRSDPLATNAVAMLTAVVLLLALSLAAGEERTLPAQPITWLGFLYTATLGSVLLFGLFVYTLKRWTASAVSYNDLLIPLVTITIATSLTGERISPTFLIGGAVVMAGVFVGAFLTLPRRKRASTMLPECIAVEPELRPIQPEGPAEASPPGSSVTI
ncbi:MAG TPA: EamA family transporter [Candidatus Limnocylindria bacterium]